MINQIEEENKKIKQTLDAAAQAKVDSGKWQATNNNGQTVIYPTGYTPFNAYPKSASSPKPVSNTTSMVDELAALQKKQKQAELERAKEAALSNLTAEGKATGERYRTDINDTATGRDIQLKNFFENTANRGQTYSGSTSQGELSQNISKQNAISELRAAKANAAADIARRKSLAEQGYLDDVNSANTTIDIASMQNQIDLQREQEKNALTAEQNKLESALSQAKLMAELGDYSGLEALGYNTQAMQQEKTSKLAQTTLENELNKAKLMADMGDFSGLKALGYDTTQFEKQWKADLAKTNRTNTGSSTKAVNPATIYEKALTMKEKVYPSQDIINYVLMQGLDPQSEFELIDGLGYYDDYKNMMGTGNTQGGLFTKPFTALQGIVKKILP